MTRKVDGSNESNLLGRYLDAKCSLLDSFSVDILQPPTPNPSFQTILKCEYGIPYQVPRIQICRNHSTGCHLKLLHHKCIVDVEIGSQTCKERTTDTKLGKTDNILDNHFLSSRSIPDSCFSCCRYEQWPSRCIPSEECLNADRTLQLAPRVRFPISSKRRGFADDSRVNCISNNDD